jgi:hypothetical protein
MMSDKTAALDHFNEQWAAGPPPEFAEHPWLFRYTVANSWRPDAGGVLRSVGGPLIHGGRVEQIGTTSDLCDERLVGSLLELVTGFVDVENKDAVVAAIACVAGTEENIAALEWSIKRLLRAMDGQLSTMLEAYPNVFAEAGVIAPKIPIASVEDVLGSLAEHLEGWRSQKARRYH